MLCAGLVVRTASPPKAKTVADNVAFGDPPTEGVDMLPPPQLLKNWVNSPNAMTRISLATFIISPATVLRAPTPVLAAYADSAHSGSRGIDCFARQK
jgi:hypothetical protein